MLSITLRLGEKAIFQGALNLARPFFLYKAIPYLSSLFKRKFRVSQNKGQTIFTQKQLIINNFYTIDCITIANIQKQLIVVFVLKRDKEQDGKIYRQEQKLNFFQALL